MDIIAQLDILCAQNGHKKEKITIDDDSPENRAKLAEHITKLVKDGFFVSLSDGRRIEGYDPVTNEWLLQAKKGGKKSAPAREPAKDKPATAVAPLSGG